VANALDLQDDPLTFETRQFVRMFNKFFDLLNVRSLMDATHERNPDKEPYRCANDKRLQVVCTFGLCFLLFSLYFKRQWLAGDFLGYLAMMSGKNSFYPGQIKVHQPGLSHALAWRSRRTLHNRLFINNIHSCTKPSLKVLYYGSGSYILADARKGYFVN